ncbi:hypothetical protein [Nocardia sp. CA-119907]|uniref:hypothetical protein n=1 Tax=Nocardia sp. CA-119907 TaxID=3239973 RepID=UPI003D983074
MSALDIHLDELRVDELLQVGDCLPARQPQMQMLKLKKPSGMLKHNATEPPTSAAVGAGVSGAADATGAATERAIAIAANAEAILVVISTSLATRRR